jgi:hypothetical protein
MLAPPRSAASLANPVWHPCHSSPPLRLHSRSRNNRQPQHSTLHPHRSLACLYALTANYPRSLDHTHIDAMVSFKAVLLLAGAVMHAQAQDFSDLVGTWSSKSNSTFTGDVRQNLTAVFLGSANGSRASTTPSTTTSPSPNTRASATRSPPTAISRRAITALVQTVRPIPFDPDILYRAAIAAYRQQSGATSNTYQPPTPNAQPASFNGSTENS